MSLKLVPAATQTRETGLARRDNPFCALVARTAGGAQACLRFQAAVERHLTDKLAPYQARCFAGLTDVAVPVVVGGEHVASLLAGQVFRQRPCPQDFTRMTKLMAAWGCDVDLPRKLSGLKSAYFQTRVVSEKEFQGMVGLLKIFAGCLANFANRWLIEERGKEQPSVARAKEYVQAHWDECFTMREVAQRVNLSSWHFCKLFKKAAGLGFSEYVSRVRVEKAKELLWNPHAPITEIAFASGFQSVHARSTVTLRLLDPNARDVLAEAQTGSFLEQLAEMPTTKVYALRHLAHSKTLVRAAARTPLPWPHSAALCLVPRSASGSRNWPGILQRFSIGRPSPGIPSLRQCEFESRLTSTPKASGQINIATPRCHEFRHAREISRTRPLAEHLPGQQRRHMLTAHHHRHRHVGQSREATRVVRRELVGEMALHRGLKSQACLRTAGSPSDQRTKRIVAASKPRLLCQRPGRDKLQRIPVARRNDAT